MMHFVIDKLILLVDVSKYSQVRSFFSVIAHMKLQFFKYRNYKASLYIFRPFWYLMRLSNIACFADLLNQVYTTIFYITKIMYHARNMTNAINSLHMFELFDHILYYLNVPRRSVFL